MTRRALRWWDELDAWGQIAIGSVLYTGFQYAVMRLVIWWVTER